VTYVFIQYPIQVARIPLNKLKIKQQETYYYIAVTMKLERDTCNTSHGH